MLAIPYVRKVILLFSKYRVSVLIVMYRLDYGGIHKTSWTLWQFYSIMRLSQFVTKWHLKINGLAWFKKWHCISRLELEKRHYHELYGYEILIANWKSRAQFFKPCSCVLDKSLKANCTWSPLSNPLKIFTLVFSWIRKASAIILTPFSPQMHQNPR